MSNSAKSAAAPIEFINKSKLDFKDISSESFREYIYPCDGKFVKRRIDFPTHLNVSDSGGHRLFDAEGISHYMPPGWIELRWKAKDGQPHFVA